MPFSIKQQEYLNSATHRWNIKTGATGSGKTWIDYAYVIPKRILNCQDRGLIVLMGNTKSSIERNVLTPMRRIWTPQMVGQIKQNDGTVNLFGKECFVTGADKANQASRIQGGDWEYAYGDEIPTWAQIVFEMVKSRLRMDNSCFDGTGNPDYPTHYFKKFLDSNSDIYHQHYCLDDNPFLSDEVKDNLKRDYEGTIYYDRYILGLWVRAEGLVYPNYQKATVSTEDRAYEEYAIAVDYGIHNPTCFGLFGRVGNVWYLVKEYYHSGRETRSPKTDEEYYQELERFAGGLNIRRVYIDPSASSFITLIRRKERFSVREADNAVLDGIRNTSTVLNTGILKINDCCARTIEEFGMYSWDERFGEDKPIKENDHAMDMMRYFVQTMRRKLLPRG